MKKTLRLSMLVISLVIAMSMVMAACAPQPEAAAEPAEQQEEAAQPQEEAAADTADEQEPEQSAGESSGEPVTITVWDIPENEGYTAWWKDYVAAFNAANPDIQVNWESFESESYKQKIESALVAGTTPDIFYHIPGAAIEEYYRQGKMLPIEDLYDISPYTDPGVAGCSIDGKMVCHPLYISISAFYYNKEQFAQAGIDPETDWANPDQPTWDEFIDACETLKAAGLTPIAMGNKDNWPLTVYIWGGQNRYGGTDPLLSAIDGSGSYTHESFVKGAEIAQLLATSDYFPTGFNGIGGTDKYLLLPQGSGAMYYYGPWVIDTLASAAPEGFEFGMFKYPSFADGNADSQSDVEGGMDALWVSGNTEHPDEVALFLQGLTQVDQAVSFMKESHFTPAIKDIEEAAVAAEVDPAVLTLMRYGLEAGHSYPWWDWVMPPAVAEEMLNMSQPLSTGEITPEEFAARLQAKADELE